jgi:hypothetical protein
MVKTFILIRKKHVRTKEKDKAKGRVRSKKTKGCFDKKDFMGVFMNTKAERRQCERYLFPNESNAKAKLNLFDGDNTAIVADIITLSEEGLGLSYGSNLPVALCEDDWIMLKGIEGLPGLNFLKDLEMKLRWVMAYRPSKGMCFGCLFDNISPVVKEQIRQFVHEQINQKPNGA